MRQYTVVIPGRPLPINTWKRMPDRDHIKLRWARDCARFLVAVGCPAIEQPALTVVCRYPDGQAASPETLAPTVGHWAAAALILAEICGIPPDPDVRVAKSAGPMAETVVIVSDPGSATIADEAIVTVEALLRRLRAAARRLSDPNPARMSLGPPTGTRMGFEDVICFADAAGRTMDALLDREDMGAVGEDGLVGWLADVRVSADQLLAEAC